MNNLKLKKYLKNPIITIILFIIANLLSFNSIIQDNFFYMFGVLGNFILTFSFAFLLITTGLNLDEKIKLKLNFSLFKYLSYFGILIYFIMYFKFMTTIHYSFVLGYFILSYGIYIAFKFHYNKKLKFKYFY